jgi:hypothetical protein
LYATSNIIDIPAFPGVFGGYTGLSLDRWFQVLVYGVVLFDPHWFPTLRLVEVDNGFGDEHEQGDCAISPVLTSVTA